MFNRHDVKKRRSYTTQSMSACLSRHWISKCVDIILENFHSRLFLSYHRKAINRSDELNRHRFYGRSFLMFFVIALCNRIVFQGVSFIDEISFKLTNKQWKRRIFFDHLSSFTRLIVDERWVDSVRVFFLYFDLVVDRCEGQLKRTNETNKRMSSTFFLTPSPSSTSRETKIKWMCSNNF